MAARPGDFWFATDSDGHAVFMTPARRGRPRLERIGRSAARPRRPSPELKQLAARGRCGAALERGVPGRRRARPHRLGARRLDRLGLLRGPVAGGPGHDPRRGGAGRSRRLALDAAARRPAALRPAPSGGPRGHRHRVAPRLGARLAARRRRRGHRARAGPSRSRAATRRTSSAGSPPRSTRWASALPGGWRRSAGCTSSRGRRTA